MDSAPLAAAGSRAFAANRAEPSSPWDVAAWPGPRSGMTTVPSDPAAPEAPAAPQAPAARGRRRRRPPAGEPPAGGAPGRTVPRRRRHGTRPTRVRPAPSSRHEILGLWVVADDGVGGLLGVQLEPLADRDADPIAPQQFDDLGVVGEIRAGRVRGNPTSSGHPGTAAGTVRSESDRPRRRSRAPRGCACASTWRSPPPSRRSVRAGRGSPGSGSLRRAAPSPPRRARRSCTA